MAVKSKEVGLNLLRGWQWLWLNIGKISLEECYLNDAKYFTSVVLSISAISVYPTVLRNNLNFWSFA